MKKIYLKRHVTLNDGTNYLAGEYTLTEAIIHSLEKQDARIEVIEDLTPVGKPKAPAKAIDTAPSLSKESPTEG